MSALPLFFRKASALSLCPTRVFAKRLLKYPNSSVLFEQKRRMVFQLVHSTTGDGDIPVNKYKSTETGISVVIAQVPGPIVHGHIILATEAHDDQGIPHTLEHLVFMGSEDYPYKGVLDILANRCLASGTNACTDVDHTYYTISTAGPDGILNLLPIYLDHILYPTMTDASYVTEIHHINANGEDGGVVYCEMQGRENDGVERCWNKFLAEVYPGICGYKSRTGGILKDIRESLTNKRIQDYHAAFYRPENTCVLIAGTVSDDLILSKIAEYETKILEKRKKSPPEPFIRPWQSPVPPFTESVTKELEYPCDDDDNGIVVIGWRGPSCVTDFQSSISIDALCEYLNDTAVSPLQQTFVEIDDPYCSEIDFNFIENSDSCMSFMFESIPKKKLNGIQDRLFELLKSIASSPETLDMTRMKTVIHRKKMQLLSSLEDSPMNHISSAVVGSFLYGTAESDLDARICQIPLINELSNKDASFWCDLLNKYFVSRPYVAIIGKPSPALQKSAAKSEKMRIEEQRNKLGPDGLAARGKILDEANATNQIPPPPEMLSSLPVPSTQNISFHVTRRLTAETASEINNLKVPFKFVIDDMKTNFVTFNLLLNSSKESSTGSDGLKDNLRLYLPLYCQLLAESAIERNGTRIPYQDVVTQLATDSISNSTSFGLGGYFIQLVLVRLQVERQNYIKGINWLREIIFETVFEEERVSVVVKRLLNDLAMTKRMGDQVCWDLIRNTAFDSRCNEWTSVTHRQINFLKKVSSLLKKEPSTVINDLNQLKDFLSSSENLVLHIAMNQEKTAEANGNIDLYQPLIEVFLPNRVRQSMVAGDISRPITKTSELVTIPGSLEERGVIGGIGSVDSNYLRTCVRVPISSVDPDLPAVLVLIEYLQQLEGPLWREVRGQGLSYGCHIQINVHSNLLHFELYRSSNPAKAFSVSKKIVENHCKNQVEWSEKLLESCRASLMFQLINKVKNISKVATDSLRNYLLNHDINHNRDLIIKVSKVTLEDIKRVGPIYLEQLFDDAKIIKAVTCNTSKVAETSDELKKVGLSLRPIDLEKEESFMSKL